MTKSPHSLSAGGHANTQLIVVESPDDGLSMKLEVERTDYLAGETIDATVVVTCEEERHLVVHAWLELECRGRGNTDATRHGEHAVFDGVMTVGEHRFPVSFEVPNGPYPYAGTLFELSWSVGARAGDVRAPSVKAPISVAYQPTELALAYDSGDQLSEQYFRDQDKFTAIVLLALGVPFGGMLAAMFLMFDAGAGVLFVTAVACIIASLILGRKHVQRAITRRRLGDVELRMTPENPAPGQLIELEATFSPRHDVKISGARAVLTCSEISIKQSGRSSTRMVKDVIRDEREISSIVGEHKADEPRAFAVRFTLPEDAPLTFEFDSNKIRWSIEIEMEIDGWTDWSSTYWFTVVQNRRLIESDRSNPVA